MIRRAAGLAFSIALLAPGVAVAQVWPFYGFFAGLDDDDRRSDDVRRRVGLEEEPWRGVRATAREIAAIEKECMVGWQALAKQYTGSGVDDDWSSAKFHAEDGARRDGCARDQRDAVDRLRARLGEADFGRLYRYVFDEEPEEPPAPATTRRDQTITFRRIPYKVFGDSTFDLEARASSGLPVRFTATGDCEAAGGGVRILSAGKCWITARQPGGAQFNAAPEVEQRFTIQKASQSIASLAVPALTFGDPDVALKGTASSGLPVVFQTIGRCEVNRDRLHILGAGTCWLTASQPGSTNYAPARVSEQEIEIAKADQKITLPDWPDPYPMPLFRMPSSLELSLPAKASSGLPIAFAYAGWCVPDPEHGVLHVVGPGTCTVIANQAGNDDFNPAPSVIKTFEIVAP